MSAEPAREPQDRLEDIAEAIANCGLAVCPDFLDEASMTALARRARGLLGAGGLRRAGVGPTGALHYDPKIRGDSVRWLEPPGKGPERRYLDRMESLRTAVNRACQLGLFELEAHYARYPVGAGYERHVDAFQDGGRRRLSCILYLNRGWRQRDGGELHLWLPDGQEFTLLPRAGTLVAFLSNVFPHAVRPARRPRWSITGWFLGRA